ncbi:hypothetical protein [Nocardia asiatica]|uniref:hypothetical protein n=1 Tax=Nocardia asiatica TaxID=209252 RepID=UPI002453FE7A|nr:hypothetical protein [Nocardia asiatica]
MSNRRRRPRPAGAPEPRDYQPPQSPEPPKSAAQTEAEGVDTITVEWEGLSLRVPVRPDTWPYWTVMRHLQTDLPTGVCNLLGPRQVSQLYARHPDLTAREASRLFGELFEKIAKAVGFGSAGNS